MSHKISVIGRVLFFVILLNLSAADALPQVTNPSTIELDRRFERLLENPEFKKVARKYLKYLVVGHSSNGVAAARTRYKREVLDIEPPPHSLSGKSVTGKPLRNRISLDFIFGFIDDSGNETIPLKYYRVQTFSEKLAGVRLNDKWGFVDLLGKQVIPRKYDWVAPFNEGLAAVSINGKAGYIDKLGKKIIPFKYGAARTFSEGLAAVQVKTKWGFIDKSGKEVVSPKYDYVAPNAIFSEGLIPVRKGKKWGYISRTGKVGIPFQYELATSFVEGAAKVVFDGKVLLIDKTGKRVFSRRFDDISSFSSGLAVVKLDGKYGVINKSGKEVIPLIYDYVWCHAFRDQGVFGVISKNKKGFVDVFGNTLYLD